MPPSLNKKENEILAANTPEALFSGDLSLAKKEYRDYAKSWHPDHNTSLSAPVVFDHITNLFNQAKDKLEKNTVWDQNNVLTITDNNKKNYKIKYLRKHTFELGEMYLANTLVLYIIKDDILFKNAMKTIQSFHYHDDNMKAEMQKYLPNIKCSFSLDNKQSCLIVNKTEDLLLLKDVVNTFTLTPEHIAWILNRLYNIICWLNYEMKLTHGGINLDNLFISPPYHSVALLGGYWYATPFGTKLSALPLLNYQYLPPEIKDKKLADPRIDLDSLRLLGRTLLKDSAGSKLIKNPTVPKPIGEFLCGASNADALHEYKTWTDKVLFDSFGKRKFVELNLTANDIYKE